MRISDWPRSERPCERMLSAGAAQLSDAELLAVVLRTGCKGKSAIDLARGLLCRFGSISGILAAERAAFCAEDGIGAARYCQLSAMLEITRRALRASSHSRLKVLGAIGSSTPSGPRRQPLAASSANPEKRSTSSEAVLSIGRPADPRFSKAYTPRQSDFGAPSGLRPLPPR